MPHVGRGDLAPGHGHPAARLARPVVQASSPSMGLHIEDVNLASGSLVQVVRSQSASYTAAAATGTSKTSSSSG